MIARFVTAAIAAASVDANAGDLLSAPTNQEIALGADEHRQFDIPLARGQAVVVSLRQIDGGIQVRASESADNALPLFQDDAGRMARVRLTLIADIPKTWHIDVASRGAKPARFIIDLDQPRAVSDRDRARAKAERALADAENSRRSSGSLESGTKIATLSADQIRAQYAAAIELSEKAGDACLRLMSNAGRARYEFAVGSYAAAKKFASDALQFHCDDAKSNAAEEAVAQRTLGSALGYLGDFESSTSRAERALSLYNETGDRAYQAMELANLSANYRAMGATQKALDDATAALALAESIGDRKRAIFCRESIAAIHLQRGEYGKSLDAYRETLDAIKASPYPMIEAMSRNDMGLLYESLGEIADAKDSFRNAEEVWTRTGDDGGLAETLLNEGELAVGEGDLDNADTVFRHALEFDIAHGLKREQAHALNGLGRVAIERGKFDEAQSNLFASRDLARAIGTIVLEVSAELALGDLERRRHRDPDALPHYDQAYALAIRANDDGGKIAAIGSRARIALDAGRAADAERILKPAIEQIDNGRSQINAPELRTSYFSTQRAYYDLYIAALMQRAGPDDTRTALQVSERVRARSLRERLAERAIDISSALDRTLLVAERAAEDELRQAAWRQSQLPASATSSKRKQAQIEIDEASRRVDEARGRIRAADPRFAQLNYPAPLAFESIQRDLQTTDTAVLEYWLGDSSSYLWIITSEDIETVTLPPRSQIGRSADDLLAQLVMQGNPVSTIAFEERATADEKNDADVRRLSDALGQSVLAAAMTKTKAQTFVVIGDGELQRVPFDLLASNNPSRNFVYLPSLGTLPVMRASQKPASQHIAIVADPVFRRDDARLPSTNPSDSTPVSDRFSALPHIAKEAKTISAMVPSSSLITGFDANRTALLKADFSSDSIVHFATHSMLDLRHPELSGVVLSLYDAKGEIQDGVLRMTDIFRMKMPVDLVVLSVCDATHETGRGAEGIFGLSRAFFYAGARRLLISLWPVDDRASAQLMASFYRHLLTENQTPQSALSLAQSDLRSDKRWQSPYYWAGFVIQGDWR